MTHRARTDARRVLAYYLKTLWLRAGLKWDYENQAEVEGIVDDILSAAREERDND